MHEEKIQAGDVVRLKAGGSPMVVRAVSGDTAYCQWFAGVHLHQGTFLFVSLCNISAERRSTGFVTQAGAVLNPMRSSAP